MGELTLQPIKRLFFKSGAKRVSDKAALELSEAMEKRAIEIVEKALSLANHSDRTTIMKKDIKMAAKMIK